MHKTETKLPTKKSPITETKDSQSTQQNNNQIQLRSTQRFIKKRSNAYPSGTEIDERPRFDASSEKSVIARKAEKK